VKYNFLALLLIFLSTSIHAQTFKEWIGNGWGAGIDDASPIVVDLDSDGLVDLLIGTYDGNICHYEQTTLNTPSFKLENEILSGIDVGLFASPASSDIDGDGLLDMIVGNSAGKMFHYEQISTNADSFILITENFSNINVGSNASPHFSDFDRDGLLDLIIGTHSGNLFHYEQNDTNSINFSIITDSMNIDPKTIRVNPTIVNLDDDGLLDLIIGGNNGRLGYFEQDSIGSNNFVLQTQDLIDFHDYIYGGTTPCFNDFDDDGLIDLLVGEMDGLYYHFEQDELHSTEFEKISNNILNLMDVGSGAAPCIADLDNDGLLDIIVGEWHGNLNHFEQSGIGSLELNHVSDSLGVFYIGDYSLPTLTDLDGDGLIDLIVGEREGTLNQFEQSSLNSNNFDLITENFNAIDLERFSAPCFTDLDGDNLLDMILGENLGNLYLYEQQNSGSSSFVSISDSLNVASEPYQPTPYVVDYDSDGLIDLFIGLGNGQIFHYEQNEMHSIDFVPITDKFENIDVKNDSRIAFGDINNDGYQDLIVGEGRGGMHLFLNQTLVDIQSTQSIDEIGTRFHLYSNYPNPFNPRTTIKYSIPSSSVISNPHLGERSQNSIISEISPFGRNDKVNVTLKVYDILGREVTTLVNAKQKTGYYEVKWNAINQPSGVYFYKIQIGDFVETKKMILIR